ncbi:hypothetical protein HJ01_01277 [Flavobacterium frigoris PS1]|uniref:Uncharacterized protein n=1 Tax=Flavobacterium frigoris (strain PS1) TaxID=1086011 RepID=H7FQ17_FLAFP|nr:hypothetical protein HJ01_01277 [Flavobacterium frigoris PS1]
MSGSHSLNSDTSNSISTFIPQAQIEEIDKVKTTSIDY